ncbi:hypothetical protein TrVE_jg11601 [Triparma verrucosa]|uniref:Uncharacterized protein n=1 Tax=Triparma verrucosa TaxID=1606542 RepID=A0A9W7ERU9_9STRA|nr:hypothetical protein TrVE_jg11601 [Triparma verrucosa]
MPSIRDERGRVVKLKYDDVYIIMLMTTSLFGSGEFILWSGSEKDREIGRIWCPCNTVTIAVMEPGVLTAPWIHLGRGSQRITVIGVAPRNGMSLDEARDYYASEILNKYTSDLSGYPSMTVSEFKVFVTDDPPDDWENMVEPPR